MTREDKLYTMRGQELIEVAEKLGVKVNKKGNTLKEAKAKVIARILEAEEAKSQEAPEVKEAVEPQAETPARVEKKSHKPRQKKENPDRQVFTEKIKKLVSEVGGEFRTWEKLPSIFLIKENGKSIVEVRYGKDGYKMAINPKRVAIAAETTKIKYYLCSLTGIFKYTDTEELERIIKEYA